MSTTVEVEIDDAHEFMYQQIVEDEEDAPELEEFVEDTVDQLIYQTYQNNS